MIVVMASDVYILKHRAEQYWPLPLSRGEFKKSPLGGNPPPSPLQGGDLRGG